MAYLGTQPNDVKKNTGLYTPSEILQLTKEGSWGGSLELIEEVDITSSTANFAFTNLKENIYDVHLLQLFNYENTINNQFVHCRVSNDGGSTYESGSNYQVAFQYGGTTGTFGETRSTSATEFYRLLGNIAPTGNASGNFYFYNLGSSTKYSFLTGQQFGFESVSGATGYFHFGGYVYAVAETINALQFFPSGNNFQNISAKLYGVKQI